jgi:hypothetical protein
VVADPPPVADPVALLASEVEGGATIGGGETPRHFQDASTVDERGDPKGFGPGVGLARLLGLRPRVARGNELLAHDGLELPTMLRLESCPIRLKVLLRRKAHASVTQRVEEGVSVGVRRDSPCVELLLGFTLASLPLMRPEPRLAGRDWDLGPELDDTVLAFHHFHLSPRHVEPQPLAHVRGQGKQTSPLQAEEGSVRRCRTHESDYAALLRCSQAATPRVSPLADLHDLAECLIGKHKEVTGTGARRDGQGGEDGLAHLGQAEERLAPPDFGAAAEPDPDDGVGLAVFVDHVGEERLAPAHLT